MAQGNSALSVDPGTAAAGAVCTYLIGVDGGGTGTRVVLANADGVLLSRGAGGPSGLVHGRQRAWEAILTATREAFEQAGLVMPALSQIAMGCGLAGINNAQWAAEFTACNPGVAALAAETDAYTTLMGAHRGQPGVVIALGTGSVGEVLQPDGQRREVGGWGFPVSDEASGAWLGMRAANHLQRALDGRTAPDTLSAAVLQHCGGDKDAVFAWLGQANQTRYAELAPLVLAAAGSSAAALRIVQDAGLEVQAMADALDPQHQLPLALCGGLAAVLKPYLPADLQARAQAPLGDSAEGALILIQRSVQLGRR